MLFAMVGMSWYGYICKFRFSVNIKFKSVTTFKCVDFEKFNIIVSFFTVFPFFPIRLDKVFLSQCHSLWNILIFMLTHTKNKRILQKITLESQWFVTEDFIKR